MNLTVQQSSDYQGNDWWKWAVWLEGTDAELDKVRSVTYYLHPTFHDRIRTTETRKDGFKLKSAGWGEFNIRIEVLYKKGNTKHLKHYLELHYPEATRNVKHKNSSTNDRNMKIFLSCSVADSLVARELADNLRQQKIFVDDIANLPAGESWELLIRDQLKSSNAVVALISDNTSGWVSKEIEVAESLNIPVLKVALTSSNLKLVPPSFQLSGAKGPRVKQLAVSLAKYLYEKMI
jgi:transcription initiation factor IIF auxiliary subunit